MFEDLEQFGYEADLNNDDLNADTNWVQDRANDQVEANNGRSEFIAKRTHVDLLKDEQLDWHLRINLLDTFGDGEEGKAKRRKFETDKSLDDAIKKLQRAKYVHQVAGLGDVSVDAQMETSDVNALKLFKYPPRNTVYWSSICTREGNFYILTKPDHLQNDETLNKPSCRSSSNDNFRSGLIKNFDKIILQAEELIASKQEQEANPDNPSHMDLDQETVFVNQTLWVEKYRAKFYTDLLSDDGVNRTLLTWLKLWDECVFKIVRPAPKQQQPKKVYFDNQFDKSKFDSKKFNAKPEFKKFYRKPYVDSEDLPTDLDQYKRPQHKLALMCGAPGVGKTTLAHVCARLCGYFVCEMNASDDRTLEAFKKQLEIVLQTTATLDRGARPHCLIIDEIDGAPAASINYLINLAKSGGDTSSAADSLKKTTNKKSPTVLRRPVICICNDLYVPALSELRKFALVLHVPPIETRRLSDRLHVIATREKLICDSTVFDILCEKTERDVRSCLNTLQFLSLKSNKDDGVDQHGRVTAAHVKSQNLGLKDYHKTLFAAWNSVFTLPKFTRKRHHDVFEAVNYTSYSARFKNIGNIVDSCGEMDKIIEGLFVNYLHIPFKDPSLKLVNYGLDWLQTIDIFNRHTEETQSYEFWTYKKYLIILFHLIFASAAQFRLQYPQVLNDVFQRRTKFLALLKALMDGMQPLTKMFLNVFILIHESLPYLISIIQPDLKPVNSQLYTEKDKNELKRVVDTMLDYNLTYRQERSADGRYDFVIEPPINEILCYSSQPASETNRVTNQKKLVRTLPYVAKQLVARAIEMRRNKTREKETNTTVTASQKHVPSKESTFASQKAKGQPMIHGFLANNDPQSSQPHKNLLGSMVQQLQAPVWFRYNEGSMNAVRRNLRISDLL